MPIVDVEWVSADDGPPELARAIADAAGRVFGSAPGATWVRLRPLAAGAYAENETAAAPRAVFVRVLARRASIEDRGRCASALAAAVAACLARPVENVHVIFEPEADGRVFFGGAPDPRKSR